MKKTHFWLTLPIGMGLLHPAIAADPVDIPNPAVCFDGDQTYSVGYKKLLAADQSGTGKAVILICKLSKDKSYTYWAKATPDGEFLVNQ
ncbi:MAG: hypothetical protein Q4G28_11830 [Neisseria sp.]|nr:hypothetical protein [Neisseria sp.]